MSDHPIYDELAAKFRRRLLRPVPACKPTPARLDVLNDGTGVTGAVLWNA